MNPFILKNMEPSFCEKKWGQMIMENYYQVTL